MVDIAVDDSMVTVLSLVDGATSLFTATGGVIGGGAIEPIQVASQALVYAAEHDVQQVQPSDDRSPPRPGFTRFWLLTYAGVRMAQAESDEIDRDHPLWRLELGAQGVITALRQYGGAP